jgi:hypothetical protein
MLFGRSDLGNIGIAPARDPGKPTQNDSLWLTKWRTKTKSGNAITWIGMPIQLKESSKSSSVTRYIQRSSKRSLQTGGSHRSQEGVFLVSFRSLCE